MQFVESLAFFMTAFLLDGIYFPSMCVSGVNVYIDKIHGHHIAIAII